MVAEKGKNRRLSYLVYGKTLTENQKKKKFHLDLWESHILSFFYRNRKINFPKIVSDTIILSNLAILSNQALQRIMVSETNFGKFILFKKKNFNFDFLKKIPMKFFFKYFLLCFFLFFATMPSLALRQGKSLDIVVAHCHLF